MNSINLPSQWVEITIGEILTVVRGGSPRPKGDPRYFGGLIPWIMIADVTAEKGKFISKTRDSVTEAGAEKSRLLPKGTLILTNSATVCVPKILAVDGCIHDGFVAFPELSKNLEILYLFYYFDYIRPKIIQQNRQGITQVNLNIDIVKNITLYLPPLPEQRRIVIKIEELLTQLDAGVASLKKVQAQLKRYRQAVLKAAFEGRLTQEWRERKNASISVQKLLEQISSERKKIIEKSGKNVKPTQPISDEESAQLPKLPEEWTWVKIDALSNMITDGKHGDCQDENNSGFFFLSAKDVKNGKLHYKEARQVKKEDFLEVYNRTSLESGDIVITNSGTIGRVAVIENTPLTRYTSFQKSVAIIKPVKGFFDSHYLAYYLMGSVQSLEKKSKGTAQKNLLIRDIKDFPIAFPPHDEQQVIIEEIERYFSQIDHLEKTITTSLRQAESLRQSILKQAFEGKLVPQDPNDEPASILLERIKAEKASHTKVKKGKTLQSKSPKRKINNAN